MYVPYNTMSIQWLLQCNNFSYPNTILLSTELLMVVMSSDELLYTISTSLFPLTHHEVVVMPALEKGHLQLCALHQQHKNTSHTHTQEYMYQYVPTNTLNMSFHINTSAITGKQEDSLNQDVTDMYHRSL